jgi:hypothetical protein
MQKKTKLWMTGGAIGLLALGGVAGLASADMGGMGGGMGGGHGMWGMGGGHGDRHGGGMTMMFERYDTNKDGKVTQQEIDDNRAQWYAEFDADKNSGLSLDEFKNLWLKARNEMMVREFQFFDRDGNGQVTIEEYREPLSDMVANRDRNGDGALSREDRAQRGEGRHHRWRDGRGEGQGQGMGMGQGMGQRMMDDDGDESADETPATPPAAPANP